MRVNDKKCVSEVMTTLCTMSTPQNSPIERTENTIRPIILSLFKDPNDLSMWVEAHLQKDSSSHGL